MIEYKKKFDTILKLNRGTTVLLLIIIQSCGIRFFNGQGVLLGLIILVLSWRGLRKVKKRDFATLLILFFYLLIVKLSNVDFPYSKLIFQYLILLEAYFCLLSYRHLFELQRDFYNALKLICFHALLGYILFLLIPSWFNVVEYSNIAYKSLFNLFYVSHYQGVLRNTGLLWEPGLLQLMLNLYLFLSIKYNRHWILLLLIIAMIFTAYSSVGFIILGVNTLFYFIRNISNKARFFTALLVLALASAPIALIQNNFLSKFDGQNTSGLVRYRDYLISKELIWQKPLLGHGNFSSEYLTSNLSVSRIEEAVFSQGYLVITEKMSGGYTNGLLGLFCWYGVPLGLVAYILCFNNKIIISESTYGRIFFFLILSLTFISEPITYTSFFLLFPFSVLVFSKGTVSPLTYE